MVLHPPARYKIMVDTKYVSDIQISVVLWNPYYPYCFWKPTHPLLLKYANISYQLFCETPSVTEILLTVLLNLIFSTYILRCEIRAESLLFLKSPDLLKSLLPLR